MFVLPPFSVTVLPWKDCPFQFHTNKTVKNGQTEEADLRKGLKHQLRLSSECNPAVSHHYGLG